MRNTANINGKGAANVNWSMTSDFMPYDNEIGYQSPRLGKGEAQRFDDRLQKSHVGRKVLSLAMQH